MFKESSSNPEHNQLGDIQRDKSLSPEMSSSHDRAAIEASKARFSQLLSFIENPEQQ